MSSAGEKISYLTLLRATGILLASIGAYAATIWLGPRPRAQRIQPDVLATS